MDPRFGKNGAPPLNIGPLNAFPKDRFGNVIQKGMRVIYHPPHDLVYEVLDVKPVLDPRAPQGMCQMVLSVTFPLVAPSNQPIMELLAISAGPAPVDVSEDVPEPVKVTEN